MIKIRDEKESDYRVVRDITRKTFYNLHVLGCGERYLVHIIRGHEDLIPGLDFVLELDGRVIGNIMYTKARPADESGAEKEILTLGPIFVAPEYRRRSCGEMLMEHSFERAMSLGYDVIVILGRPADYVSSGFKSCRKLSICLEDGSFPAAMMVREFVSGALDGRGWIYHDSPVMAVSEEEARLYGDSPERMGKKYLPSQEGFYAMSHSFVRQGASGKAVAYVGLRFMKTDEALGDTRDGGRIYGILVSCLV